MFSFEDVEDGEDSASRTIEFTEDTIDCLLERAEVPLGTGALYDQSKPVAE